MKLAGIAVVAALIVGGNLVAANFQDKETTVRIKGVHLCCGACVAGVNEALDELKGVTDVAADRNGKVVVFKAKDDKTAKASLEALAKAGYYGRAAIGDKDVKFPDPGVKKGTKVDKVVLSNVHLCCGACVTAAQKSLEKVNGLTRIAIDRNEKTISLGGKGVDLLKAIGALNDAGFYAKVKKEKKDPKGK